MSDYDEQDTNLADLQELQLMQSLANSGQSAPQQDESWHAPLRVPPSLDVPPQQSSGHLESSAQPESSPNLMQNYSNSPIGVGVSDDQLAKALELQSSNQFNNNMGRAFNTIGSALGTPNKPVDNSFYDSQDKQASQPLNSLMQRAKFSKDKELAEFRRALMAKHGIGLEQGQQRIDESKARHADVKDIANKKLGLEKEKFDVAGNPGQKMEDITFGKSLAEYKDNGGFVKTQDHLNNLKSLIERLKSNPDLTGKKTDFLPESVRAAVDPEGLKTQKEVQNVVLDGLKQVFGGKVAAQEMQTYLTKSYDPRLSPADNVEILSKLYKKIENEGKAKTTASDYWQSHNSSMKGYKPQKEGAKQAPVKGEERSGYIFLGGDPSNKNSWRKK